MANDFIKYLRWTTEDFSNTFEQQMEDLIPAISEFSHLSFYGLDDADKDIDNMLSDTNTLYILQTCLGVHSKNEPRLRAEADYCRLPTTCALLDKDSAIITGNEVRLAYPKTPTGAKYQIIMKSSAGYNVTVADVFYPNIINLRTCKGTCVSYLENILRIIIPESLKILALDEAAFKNLYNTQGRSLLADTIKQKYIQRKNELIRSLESSENEISSLQARIASVAEKIEIQNAEISAIENMVDGSISKIISELEKISDVNGVKSIDLCSDIGQGVISFTTETIYIKCQGRRYLIGDFRVYINLNDCTLRFENLDPDLRRRSAWGDGCHHPHISNTGTACLGNVSQDLAAAFKDHKFAYIALVAINYLRSVNLNDVAGKHIEEWPIVDEYGNVLSNKASLLRCICCGDVLPSDSKEYSETVVRCNICNNVCHKSCACELGDEFYVCDDCIGSKIITCHNCGKQISIENSCKCSYSQQLICKDCAEIVEVRPKNARTMVTQSIPIDKSLKDEALRTCDKCGVQFIVNERSDTLCSYCREGNEILTCKICNNLIPDPHNAVELDMADGKQHICIGCVSSGRIDLCSKCHLWFDKDELSTIKENGHTVLVCNNCKDGDNE